MSEEQGPDLDVAVVGAGFAGLYLLHRLRSLGFSARVFERAAGVGGTWYWNRYPGARCDIPTTDYAFSFDPELEDAWTWSEKYATQPEILRYLEFVADRYDLRRDITFEASVASATWNDASRSWELRIDRSDGTSETVTSRFHVMATGCLSVPKAVDIEGLERFVGDVYSTSSWPHDGVDFTGQRVGVIGTGSSGIQSIPLIAQEAAELTVFQRTPNYSIPAHNGPPPAERLAQLDSDRDAYRAAARVSATGQPRELTMLSALRSSPEVRRERFEAAWAAGELFEIAGVFNDVLTDRAANEIVAEMIREKIRGLVDDPETAEALCPRDYPFGTKRPCLDTGYYETFNLPHVRLVDLRRTPITTISERGVELDGETVEVDALVLATGFDAMTGALVSVDIAGRDGVTLSQQWADGPATYLGLTAAGFPNLFMITGPGSPSVLSNMTVSIEQHVDWVVQCIADLGELGFDTIEATHSAVEGWTRHVADGVAVSLYPEADSWYMGANVPGKARAFLAYVGGVAQYRDACERAREQDYLGFELRGPDGSRRREGEVCRLQPDVWLVLDAMAKLGMPAIEGLPVDTARMLMAATEAVRPPGPEVGEVVDGTLPGGDGESLRYRLWRPESAGPHPLVVYFHGGGWVLGSEVSDEPLCRDLCVRAGVAVISVDYRHAPESPFPAAVEDAQAALAWVADHVEELGGRADRLAVAGWSAGANLATVVARLARDAEGPELAGQLLITPVASAAMETESFRENGDGYQLTAALMRWFFDHYVEAPDRLDPRVSPLLAEDLSALPPAVVVVAEFDPLRDEGRAYAEALARAGVQVEVVEARGQIHTSLTMVDTVRSASPVRAEAFEAFGRLLA